VLVYLFENACNRVVDSVDVLVDKVEYVVCTDKTHHDINGVMSSKHQ